MKSIKNMYMRNVRYALINGKRIKNIEYKCRAGILFYAGMNTKNYFDLRILGSSIVLYHDNNTAYEYLFSKFKDHVENY